MTLELSPPFPAGRCAALPTFPPSGPSVTWGHAVTTRGDVGDPSSAPRSPWTLLTQRHLQGQRRRSRAAMVSMVTSRPNPAGQRCPPSATHLRSWGLPRPQAEDEHI